MSQSNLSALRHPLDTVRDVHRVDEVCDDDDLDEWEWLFGDVRSSIEQLQWKFDSNETVDVLPIAWSMFGEVQAIHEAAGLLPLSTDPVIDIGGDLALAKRLADAAADDGGERTADEAARSDVGVSFRAIAEGASRACELVDRGLGAVVEERAEPRAPAAASLERLARAAAVLEEWAQTYVEAALGYYRAKGHLPDSVLGGGTLSEMHDWERVRQLRAALDSVSAR